MSSKYKTSKEVPSDILCSRLDVLSNAVTLGKKEIDREFYMRVPAEVDNDADLVIMEASDRIATLQAKIDRLQKAICIYVREMEDSPDLNDENADDIAVEYFVDEYSDSNYK